jgi:hypothetical protein
MTYTKNNKTYSIPNEELEKLQAKLNISRAEACDLWLADNDYEENEEQVLLNEKAKAVTRERVSSEKGKPRKPRTVKISDEKQMLFRHILKELSEISSDFEVLTENKLIGITIGDKKFKINITECRKPKN